MRSFFGPHIAGDAVDVANGVVLTGSWRVDNPLEVGLGVSPAPRPCPRLRLSVCLVTVSLADLLALHGLVSVYV